MATGVMCTIEYLHTHYIILLTIGCFKRAARDLRIAYFLSVSTLRQKYYVRYMKMIYFLQLGIKEVSKFTLQIKV